MYLPTLRVLTIIGLKTLEDSMSNLNDLGHTAGVSEKPAIPSSSGNSSFEDTSNESGLTEGDYGSQQGHVFEDERAANYWRGV